MTKPLIRTGTIPVYLIVILSLCMLNQGCLIANTGTFEFRQIVFGHLLMVPFPMYAPPGSKLEGPIDVVEPLLAD